MSAPILFFSAYSLFIVCCVLWKHWHPLKLAFVHDWWSLKYKLGRCTQQQLYWAHHCLKWRGKVLTGKYSHWCHEWDGLPIDETCIEWPCDSCYNLEGRLK